MVEKNKRKPSFSESEISFAVWFTFFEQNRDILLNKLF